MQEVWKSVVGYEGIYEVSDHGRIRSKKGTLKPIKNQKGYLRVSLCGVGKPKSKTVHSLVMEAFVGERPEGMHIEHIDHDKERNAVENLRYCSGSENERRKVQDGRRLMGEKHHASKLTEDDVRFIRGYQGSMTSCGKILGVSYKTVQDVLEGRTWKDVI